jgi:hypothetical protein
MQMTLYTAGFDWRGSRGSMCMAECDVHGDRRGYWLSNAYALLDCRGAFW